MKRGWAMMMAFAILCSGEAALAAAVSRQEAIAIAKSRTNGRVISAELVRPERGNAYYRVKILTNGRIQMIRVDAGRR